MTSIFNLVSSSPESPTLAASALPPITGNSASETGSESTRASLSRSGSPSDRTAATSSAGSKRPAEDLDQYAVLTAHRVRLKPAGQQELERVAKLPPAQRSIWMGGQLLKLNEQLTAIQPTNAQWDIPKTLRDKIENYTFIVLLSPVLSYYLGKTAGASSPVKLVQGILENHPSWGFTKEVRADKYKCDIVVKRIQVRLTDRRAEIKEAIMLSLGPDESITEKTVSKASKKKMAGHVKLNIVELCQVVVAKYAASNAVVTIQMCARFAFLRKILLEMTKKPQLEASGGYWALVDTELSAVRECYKDEPVKLTKLLTQSLKADQEMFGHAEVPLASTSEDNTINGPNRAQNIADSAACGMFIDDEDDY
ncbi:hypothetical protein B0H21DRAFT_827875 [Amylocystis lapponica]|nr:hypothetical protein B0H21DRAFT_827875 [Amylocystis lapponica]